MLAAFAIPALLFFVLLEYLFCRRFRPLDYLALDTLSNLAAGLLSHLTRPLLKIVGLSAYIIIYDNCRLLNAAAWPPLSFYASLPCYFLLLDFCFYLSHRATHRINFLWAMHIVHHHSERLNLSIAFRRSAISPLFTFVFELPLALLGLPLWWFVPLSAINIFYQFLIHTETIDKLGWCETFMNTPSHHRVHHGRDPKYLDKNFASVFIIWDKLLGTFQPEEEIPDYGVTTPPANFNPITANLHFYKILYRASKRQTRIVDKLALWFLPPEKVEKQIPAHRTSFSKMYQQRRKLPHLLPLTLCLALITLLTFITLLAAEQIESAYLPALLLIIAIDLSFRFLLNKPIQPSESST